MPLSHKTILVIDDTASIRVFLRIGMQTLGATFLEASSASEGLALLNQHKPDLVILDLGLPDRDGLDIIPDIKKQDAQGRAPQVVILSVRKDVTTRERAFALGADAYIAKPFIMDELLEVVSNRLCIPHAVL